MPQEVSVKIIDGKPCIFLGGATSPAETIKALYLAWPAMTQSGDNRSSSHSTRSIDSDDSPRSSFSC